MTEKKRTINGRNLSGENREYTFHLMSARTGLDVFHNFSAECQLFGPMLVERLSASKDTDPGDFDPSEIKQEALELVQYFPIVTTWNRLKILNREMLAGCVVKTADRTITFDKEGFGDLDPIECYLALFYAIVANYEPYIAPLLGALDGQGETDLDPISKGTTGA